MSVFFSKPDIPPTNGTVWRIGNPDRGALKVGDIVHKGEELGNIEAMKMENPITAPFDGQLTEISVSVNNNVIEGQLLFVLEQVKPGSQTQQIGLIDDDD